MNRRERRASASQYRRIGVKPGDMHRTKVCVITPEHTYAWEVAAIPAIVAALRKLAEGQAPSSSFVFADGDGNVGLTDNALAGQYQTMTTHAARKIADIMESLHRELTAGELKDIPLTELMSGVFVQEGSLPDRMTLEATKALVANLNAGARELPPDERYQIVVDEAAMAVRVRLVDKDIH
jgi:hypothetical protein